MPTGPATPRRWRYFERMEPRQMLAGDLAPGVAAGDALADDVVMHLPGSIAGSVFAAAPTGGAYDADGAGISGVRLELLDNAGEMLAEAITDEAGGYEFPALPPGVYGVRQWQPEGFLDGQALVGSGGGTVLVSNFISEIVVQAGAMLKGYDFTELPQPVIAAMGSLDGASLAGFLPPLSVEWRRPAEIVIPYVSDQIPKAPLSMPPLESRVEEPIFGGSSRPQGDAEPEDEAFLRDDDREDRIVKSAGIETPPESVERVAIDRRRHAARDQAFEIDEESEEDEVADAKVTPAREPGVAEPATPANRVAAKPAA